MTKEKEAITAVVLKPGSSLHTPNDSHEFMYPIAYDPDFETIRKLIADGDGIPCSMLEFVRISDEFGETCLAVSENGIAERRPENAKATGMYPGTIYGTAIYFPVPKSELMD